MTRSDYQKVTCSSLPLQWEFTQFLASRLENSVPFRHHITQLLWFLVLATFLCSTSVAQKTIVKDAGSGVKQEFDYDAGNRVVEVRTLNPDGKINGRTVYAYGPHSEIAKQVTTNYWTDGHSIHMTNRSTNDENSNFTSEVVEEFDEAGKHTIGHEIYVDRTTGIYRCFSWNAAPSKYEAIECPSGEESHEGPTEVRKLDRAEVMMQLNNARQAAQAELKSHRMAPKNPVDASAQTVSMMVGILLPADLRPGQRVSGSIVADPGLYGGYPDLRVVRVTLPGRSASDVSRPGEWNFEVEGFAPQPADGPFSFVVPRAATTMTLTLRQAGDSSVAISQQLEISPLRAQKSASSDFLSPALCFIRQICQVAGPFSGNSQNTFAAFDSNPARILAQTETVAFVAVPEFVATGPYTLIVAEGGKVAAVMMVVADIAVTPDAESIAPGHDLATTLRITGIEELTPPQWKYGIFPASNLERARSLVPGLNPSKVIEKDREQREKQERQDGLRKKEDDKWEESAGMVLVAFRNTTPDVGVLRGSAKPLRIFRLGPDSFERGAFVYNQAIDPLKSGIIVMQATAIPFLAPVKATVFDADASTKN